MIRFVNDIYLPVLSDDNNQMVNYRYLDPGYRFTTVDARLIPFYVKVNVNIISRTARYQIQWAYTNSKIYEKKKLDEMRSMFCI